MHVPARRRRRVCRATLATPATPATPATRAPRRVTRASRNGCRAGGGAIRGEKSLDGACDALLF
ncbi:thioredoxin [Burkholderia pseudomallei]|uniref:thioredoxin n=1 Tax=Burkholderia pseudomallei TaxID=28450 RepID=UPI00097578F2|nr:thioredoxin [Burkholderia pseudomallei]OMZ69558.1 thioredoxin [Burkholderia pseudomallei]